MLCFRFKNYRLCILRFFITPDLSPKPDLSPVFFCHENVTNRENLFFNKLIGKLRLNFSFLWLCFSIFCSFLLVFKINECFPKIQPLLGNIAHMKSFTYPICHHFFNENVTNRRMHCIFLHFTRNLNNFKSYFLSSTFWILKRSN